MEDQRRHTFEIEGEHEVQDFQQWDRINSRLKNNADNLFLGNKMDLTSIHEAFDRVAKKQKVSYMKTQDVIDRVIHVAVSQIDEAAKTSADINAKGVFGDLRTSLAEFGPNNQVHKICDVMIYLDFLNLPTAMKEGYASSDSLYWFFLKPEPS